ncbi:MAG: T9SS type A sorting domain-containing protein [Flavobacterium sp.]
MKNKIAFVLLLAVTSLQAQITLSKHDGTIISNNQVLSYNSLEYSQASFEFFVRNVGNASTRVLIECVSTTNTDGTGFELCFGNQCLSEVSAGNSYPDAPVVLAPNGVNGNFDHFYNSNPGNGQIMDLVFRFYQVDLNGNEISNSITFTYRYNPNLATDSFSALAAMGVRLQSTTLQNQLEVNADKSMQVELVDIAGKIVQQATINQGVNLVDVAQLSAGVYIARFKDNQGASSSIKVVKN